MRHATVELSGVSGSQMLPPVAGLVGYVAVTYTNGNVAGDLTLADPVTGLVILQLTNHSTNIAAPLRQPAIGTDGAALEGGDGAIPVVGGILATWGGQSSNSKVKIDIWYS